MTWFMELPLPAQLFVGFALIAAVAAVFFAVRLSRRAAQAPPAGEKEAPVYEKRSLLTEYEAALYEQLVPIARKNGLHILAKVRIADFVGVRSGLPAQEWGRCFGKIKAKHVDFILADEKTLQPRVLIELDDSTHKTETVQARDALVDEIYAQAGYPIIHITDIKDLEARVREALRRTEQD